MAWLSDEQYVLMQDTGDKKITARSARHTRTHCGKGGAVKFPSDYLTKGQIKKMSGECKSYKMNEPMTWVEFKSMPDDLKILYIKSLREKFNVPCNAIADMFGVVPTTLNAWIKCLGISEGKSSGGKRTWDKEGFYAWRSGASESAVEHVETPIEETPPCKVDDTTGCCGETTTLIPVTGEMTFDGNVDDILRTVRGILSGANVRLTVKWDIV